MGRAQFILSASLMIGALLGESPFAFAQEKPAPAANIAPQASEKNSMIVTSDYYIGPQDIREIIVCRNADLSKVVTVRPDARFSLPLLGEIEAPGLTLGQLTTNICPKLKQFT